MATEGHSATKNPESEPLEAAKAEGGPEPVTDGHPNDSTAKPTARAEPPQSAIRLDESKLVAAYANFCRVTGTPEELIIDFGLNPQPMGVPQEPLLISQRIVLNLYTAKRLLGALSMSIQRHEAAFGALETDVQKRVQPRAARR